MPPAPCRSRCEITTEPPPDEDTPPDIVITRVEVDPLIALPGDTELRVRVTLDNVGDLDEPDARLTVRWDGLSPRPPFISGPGWVFVTTFTTNCTLGAFAADEGERTIKVVFGLIPGPASRDLTLTAFGSQDANGPHVVGPASQPVGTFPF